MEILFSDDKFLHGKILPRNPLPSTPPSTPAKKIPLKMSVHFPITITMRKHWSTFVTLQPLPRGLWEGKSFPET